MNNENFDLISRIRRSTRRLMTIGVASCAIMAGVVAAYFGVLEAKKLGKLVENQADRIVNNAIVSQDLLSIQTELARAWESINESMGADLYTEIYVNDNLVAQMGSKTDPPLLAGFHFVQKRPLANETRLEIRVFPDYRKAYKNWLWSVLVILTVGIALSLVIESITSSLLRKWLRPLVKTVEEINEITRTIQRCDRRRIEIRASDITEISSLTDAVNKLLSSIETSQEQADEAHAKFLESERHAAKDRAVAEISAMIAHDLRAPLSTFERLLFPDPKVTIPQEIRASIRDSLNRLHAMIEAFRYSEIETIINKKATQLQFYSGAQALLLQSEKRNIELQLPTGTYASLMLDHAKFERAWINLVSNSIEFAKALVVLELDIQGVDLFLRVIDDGPGVPDEFLPKLFQRGATYGKSDGTGLGLAYVRQIMRGHGGDVTYRRENNLTIFECRLPNAAQTEKEQVVENAVSMDNRLVQKLVRSVAICLEPRELTQSVLAELTSYDSDEFSFSEERDGANIVVSNRDDIMFEVLERDDQEYLGVAHLKFDETTILRILKIKFNLGTEGEASV